MDLALAQRAAFHVAEKNNTVALLQWGSIILFARHTSQEAGPFSAVTRLIQGVYEEDSQHARKILRNRIFSTASSTELCLGMVKVAAKRLTSEIITEPNAEKYLFREITYIPQLREAGAKSGDMSGTRELLSGISKRSELYDSDRSVAAILVGPDQKIISSALNQNAKNRTLHAEVCLIQNLYLKTGKPIPPGSTLFTTRKPCKMCAGMIWQWSDDPTQIRVPFDEDDRGSHARETVLNTGSVERKRAAKNSKELLAEIQFKISADGL